MDGLRRRHSSSPRRVHPSSDYHGGEGAGGSSCSSPFTTSPSKPISAHRPRRPISVSAHHPSTLYIRSSYPFGGSSRSPSSELPKWRTRDSVRSLRSSLSSAPSQDGRVAVDDDSPSRISRASPIGRVRSTWGIPGANSGLPVDISELVRAFELDTGSLFGSENQEDYGGRGGAPPAAAEDAAARGGGPSCLPFACLVKKHVVSPDGPSSPRGQRWLAFGEP